jgi:biopolymer transport protein ExbB/TolQ
MCFVATIASLVVATITTVFEKILRNGIDMKSEYEKLYEQLKK